MAIIVIFILILACMLSVQVRLAIRHPIKTVCNMIVDTYQYFHDRKYDRYDGGQLNCYCAHFGGGKTLSATHYVRFLYERYNNKKIYDRQRKKWVLQKVLVLSNVDLLGIEHFEKLENLQQIVDCAKSNKKFDDEHDTRTCVIVLLDEASSILNSRNFKTNIDANFLSTLITSRHFHMSIYYTSQKFKLSDALLRSVTQRVIWCDKHWRFMVQNFYDADEMEYATNPELVKPFRRKGFFITNKDYNNYDTLATVEQLDKDTRNGKMMTSEEILALRGDFYGDNDSITTPSRKMKKMRKRA